MGFGTDAASLRIGFVLQTTSTFMEMHGAVTVKHVVMGYNGSKLKAANRTSLVGGESRFRARNMGRKLLLLAADQAGIPVAGLIEFHQGTDNVGNLTGQAAGVAVCVAVIVKHMGKFTVPNRAVHTDMPVILVIRRPFFYEFVLMLSLGLQNPIAIGTDLICFLGGFRAGIVFLLILLIATKLTSIVMGLLVMFQGLAKGMFRCGSCSADGTLQRMASRGSLGRCAIGVVSHRNLFLRGSAATITNDGFTACRLAGSFLQNLGSIPTVGGRFFLTADRTNMGVAGTALVAPTTVGMLVRYGNSFRFLRAASGTLHGLGTGIFTSRRLGDSAIIPGMGILLLLSANGALAFVFAVINLDAIAKAVLAGYRHRSAADVAVDAQTGCT